MGTARCGQPRDFLGRWSQILPEQSMAFPYIGHRQMVEFELKRMIKLNGVVFKVKATSDARQLTFTPNNGVAPFVYSTGGAATLEDMQEVAEGILSANTKPGFSGRSWNESYLKAGDPMENTWDRL